MANGATGGSRRLIESLAFGYFETKQLPPADL